MENNNSREKSKEYDSYSQISVVEREIRKNTVNSLSKEENYNPLNKSTSINNQKYIKNNKFISNDKLIDKSNSQIDYVQNHHSFNGDLNLKKQIQEELTNKKFFKVNNLMSISFKNGSMENAKTVIDEKTEKTNPKIKNGGSCCSSTCCIIREKLS